MLQFFKKIIKSRHIKIISICLLALVFVTIVMAVGTWQTGFKAIKDSVTTVDLTSGAPSNECKKVKNNTTDKDYFIPTKTKREWDAFKDAVDTRLAPNLTLSACDPVFNNSRSRVFSRDTTWTVPQGVTSVLVRGCGGAGGFGGASYNGASTYLSGKESIPVNTGSIITVSVGGGGGGGGDANDGGCGGGGGGHGGGVVGATTYDWSCLGNGGGGGGTSCFGSHRTWNGGNGGGAGSNGGAGGSGTGDCAVAATGAQEVSANPDGTGPGTAYGGGGGGGSGGKGGNVTGDVHGKLGDLTVRTISSAVSAGIIGDLGSDQNNSYTCAGGIGRGASSGNGGQGGRIVIWW